MKPVTKAEEQIMEAVWKTGTGFLKDIVEALPTPRPHPNTVGTILKILVDKQYVTFEQMGRNNRYRPLISREQYAKRSIATVMKNFFNGSPTQIVSHFIDSNKMTVEELQQLIKEIKAKK